MAGLFLISLSRRALFTEWRVFCVDLLAKGICQEDWSFPQVVTRGTWAGASCIGPHLPFKSTCLTYFHKVFTPEVCATSHWFLRKWKVVSQFHKGLGKVCLETNQVPRRNFKDLKRLNKENVLQVCVQLPKITANVDAQVLVCRLSSLSFLHIAGWVTFLTLSH